MTTNDWIRHAAELERLGREYHNAQEVYEAHHLVGSPVEALDMSAVAWLNSATALIAYLEDSGNALWLAR